MDSSYSTTLQPSAESNTGLVEDGDRTGPLPVTTRKNNDTRPFIDLGSCFSVLALTGPEPELGGGMVYLVLCG